MCLIYDYVVFTMTWQAGTYPGGGGATGADASARLRGAPRGLFTRLCGARTNHPAAAGALLAGWGPRTIAKGTPFETMGPPVRPGPLGLMHPSRKTLATSRDDPRGATGADPPPLTGKK